MRVMSNPSGHLPCWERCIVKPDPVEVKTAGGIIIPDTAQKAEAEATGTLMAYGPMAFQDENGEYLPGSPEIGERVSFSRYAGTLIKGADGEDYRSMKDRDIQDIVVTVDLKK
jgi:chaperonin GroES